MDVGGLCCVSCCRGVIESSFLHLNNSSTSPLNLNLLLSLFFSLCSVRVVAVGVHSLPKCYPCYFQYFAAEFLKTVYFYIKGSSTLHQITWTLYSSNGIVGSTYSTFSVVQRTWKWISHFTTQPVLCFTVGVYSISKKPMRLIFPSVTRFEFIIYSRRSSVQSVLYLPYLERWGMSGNDLRAQNSTCHFNFPNTICDLPLYYIEWTRPLFHSISKPDAYIVVIEFETIFKFVFTTVLCCRLRYSIQFKYICSLFFVIALHWWVEYVRSRV